MILVWLKQNFRYSWVPALEKGENCGEKHNRVLRLWLMRHRVIATWSLPLIPLEELYFWLPWLQEHGLGDVCLTGWPDIWLQPYEERRRQWHPTPVLLPGKSHGCRSLVGCSPWGHEESNTTEWLPFHFSLSCIRRKWQPTPVFLPGESQGRGIQVGCHLWGRTESDTTEVT